MGLTISYSFHQPDNASAESLIADLHRVATQLPFQRVGRVVEAQGDACDLRQWEDDQDAFWLMVRARRLVQRGQRESSTSLPEAHPLHVIAFTVYPGEGCEPATMGLCRSPYPILIGNREVRPGDWVWSAFCKTQYASNRAVGGAENFLRCHVSLIALLDHAGKQGLLAEIHDEGKFWEQRDPKALVETVGRWNAQMAAFVGRLKDTINQPLQAEILKYPNFENIEAKGNNQ